jgi:hypothetical protein
MMVFHLYFDQDFIFIVEFIAIISILFFDFAKADYFLDFFIVSIFDFIINFTVKLPHVIFIIIVIKIINLRADLPPKPFLIIQGSFQSFQLENHFFNFSFFLSFFSNPISFKFFSLLFLFLLIAFNPQSFFIFILFFIFQPLFFFLPIPIFK